MSAPKELIDRLPDLAMWRSSSRGAKIGLLDYVGFVATPDLFFAFAELLRPALVLHGGGYFIEEKFSAENFQHWLENLGDIEEIQKMINHIHIGVLFQDQEISDEIAVWTSRVIADTWSSVFSDLGLRGLAFGESVYDASVTLYSPRESAPSNERPNLARGEAERSSAHLGRNPGNKR